MQSYSSKGAASPNQAYVAGGLIGSAKPKMKTPAKPQPKKPTAKRSR